MTTPSPEEVLKSRTGKGGWKKKQIEEWGVSWPLRKGWKKELEQRWLDEQCKDAMERDNS